MVDLSPSKDFISKAIKKPGALKKKAKKSGMSTSMFAKKNDKGSSKAAQQSRFAEFLNKVRPGK